MRPPPDDLDAELDAQQHLDLSERLTLAELAQRQVEFYRGWGNAAGEMFAQAMERLAYQIRLTSATTPEELAVRVEILDADIREQWESIGHQERLEARRLEARPFGAFFGHMA